MNPSMVHPIYNPTYKTSSWVPKEALFGLKALRHDSDWKDEITFLVPFFENPMLRPFYQVVAKQDRDFFYGLFISLLNVRLTLFKKRRDHNDVPILMLEIKSMRNQIRKAHTVITKIQQGMDTIVPKSLHHKIFAFANFPTTLKHVQVSLMNLEEKIKLDLRRKNPRRPITQKSLPAKDNVVEFKKAERNCYARYLVVFFEENRNFELSTAEAKQHICDIADALVDLKDDQLLPKQLDDLMRSLKS